MRVLVLSIGHPEYELGGADRAAYSLFRGINSSSSHQAVFAAPVTPERMGHSGLIGCYDGRHDEMIFVPPGVDYFKMTSLDYDRLRQTFDELINASKPDIVHVTHFLHCGIDVLDIICKRHRIPAIVTFNEYTSICNYFGQMITPERQLCYQATADACADCFPSVGSGRFQARKNLVTRHLSFAAGFVAPSPFLRRRFVQYGLPDDKFATIGYVQGEFDRRPPANPAEQSDGRMRLGFFGRINPFKGVDILLKAIISLPPSLRQNLEVVLFGANLDHESQDFQDRIHQLLEAAGDNVTLFGSYSHDQTLRLMASVHWVVVPSIWWEVGPIVIEEAFAAGTPVIASDLAGMAEKVDHDNTGYLFTPGSSVSLSKTITTILGNDDRRRLVPTNLVDLNQSRINSHVAWYENRLESSPC